MCPCDRGAGGVGLLTRKVRSHHPREGGKGLTRTAGLGRTGLPLSLEPPEAQTLGSWDPDRPEGQGSWGGPCARDQGAV